MIVCRQNARQEEEAERVSGVLPNQNALRKGHLPTSVAMPESDALHACGCSLPSTSG